MYNPNKTTNVIKIVLSTALTILSLKSYAELKVIENTSNLNNLTTPATLDTPATPVTLDTPALNSDRISEVPPGQKTITENTRNTPRNNFESQYNIKPSLPHNGYYLASHLTPEELAAKAKSANKIIIKAHTDDSGYNVSVQQLALNQAENLKQLLITYGIPKNKIETSVITNNFITNNLTQSNQAKNRRITINFQ